MLNCWQRITAIAFLTGARRRPLSAFESMEERIGPIIGAMERVHFSVASDHSRRVAAYAAPA